MVKLPLCAPYRSLHIVSRVMGTGNRGNFYVNFRTNLTFAGIFLHDRTAKLSNGKLGFLPNDHRNRPNIIMIQYRCNNIAHKTVT